MGDKDTLPRLNEKTNFSNWKFRLCLILEEKGVSYTLSENVEDGGQAKYLKDDAKARSIIVQCLSDKHLEIIKACATSREMLNKLGETFERRSILNKLHLKKKLITMKCGQSEKLQDFFSRFDAAVSEVKATGCEMFEEDIICQLLTAMPSTYEHIITSIETIFTDKTISLEFTKARLLDAEIKVNHSRSEPTIAASFICYSCRMPGHKASNCAQQRQWIGNHGPRQSFQGRGQSYSSGRGHNTFNGRGQGRGQICQGQGEFQYQSGRTYRGRGSGRSRYRGQNQGHHYGHAAEEVSLPYASSEFSSSERSPPPAALDAELIRDAPLYPPLQKETEPYSNDLESTVEQTEATEALPENVETDDVTNVQRDKRSSGQHWDNTSKPSTDNRRVKTGDTILNIRGAVRDAIGDAGLAPGPRASSRLDTFVIRARTRPSHAPYKPPPRDQVPRHARELLVEAHSRARLPCDLHNITALRWYKDNELVNLGVSGGGEAIWREGSAAVVGRATRGDAGAWRCAGATSTGRTVSGHPIHLLIYEAVRSVYLAVDGRRLDAGNTWVPVRDKTELEVRCVAEGGVPPPELSWRLLALEPTLDHRPYLRIHQTNYSIEGVSVSHAVVTAARELHNATLQCEAKQRRPSPSPLPSPQPEPSSAPASPVPTADPDSYDVLTAKLEIHVTYPPSFVISRWPGFGVSLSAGGAAALRCDVDANPPARAWWLRDDDNPTSSPPPLESGLESRGSATLRWAALRGAHAGWYRCRASWLDAEYSSIGYYLNVISADEQTEPATEASTAEDEDVEPEVQKVDVPVGGNVQLHCPKGSVGCWWRKVVGNTSEAWAPAGSHHAHGVLGIKDAVYQEGGEYRCVGARGGGRDAARLRELKRVTVRVSGGATAAALTAQPSRGGWRLECGACGRGVRVVWLRARRPPEPASLAPDLAQHCWRAVLHVREPDEVWCVAAAPGGGAVAVFPPRAPHPSPAPARHTVRAPYNAAVTSPHRAALVCVIACVYVLGVV